MNPVASPAAEAPLAPEALSPAYQPRLPGRAIAAALVALVRLYQWSVGPLLGILFGAQCRFEPTCSHYMIGAVRKYGPWRGLWKGLARVARCHPWHAGGYDPP